MRRQVDTTKAPQNKVDVAVERINLGISKQLVSLAACRRFLLPASFPYSDAVRDPKPLMLKLAQVGSLQRKIPVSKGPKGAPSAHQQQQKQAPPAGQQLGSTFPAGCTEEAGGGTAASPAASEVAGGEVEGVPSGIPTARESREGAGRLSHAAEEKAPEPFLSVPATGPWAACGEDHKQYLEYLPLCVCLGCTCLSLSRCWGGNVVAGTSTRKKPDFLLVFLMYAC